MRHLMTTNRRQFLKDSLGGAAAIGIGNAIPECFSHAATKTNRRGETILVVVQLSGGNDGLNTVVPYADDAYYAARPKLAVAKNEVLRCNDELGLHPSLRSMHELLESGQLSIVSGVGYDQPNRSHFESMDIWHTCRRKEQARMDGWLGRFLDSQDLSAGGDVPAMHLGREQQPFAIASQTVRVPTVTDMDEFQLQGADRQALRELLISPRRDAIENSPAPPNDLLRFLESSTTSALAASQRVTEASAQYASSIAYPDTELGKKLRVVAQLIDAGLSTRIYYVQLDGFDTHAQQAPAHSSLLKQWSDAVGALVRDLDAHDHADRVCVMTFTEFGRRVAENASEGTDHGAAGPMFFCGGSARSSIFESALVGGRPNLTGLQDGDLKHEFDFRQVYAATLQSWLGVDPSPIVGEAYSPLPLFA